MCSSKSTLECLSPGDYGKEDTAKLLMEMAKLVLDGKLHVTKYALIVSMHNVNYFNLEMVIGR